MCGKRCQNVFIGLKKDLFGCFRIEEIREKDNETGLKEGGGIEMSTTVLSITRCTLSFALYLPLCQTTDILSSIPLHPLGIVLKSSLPNAFWLALNVALSVPTQSNSLFFKARIKSSLVVGSSRKGGDLFQKSK